MRNNELRSFEVFIFFVGERSLFGSNPFVGQFLNLGLTHFGFNWFEGQGFNEVEIGVTSEGSENPEEGLFVLIVGLGGDVEVLEVTLAVEGDLAGFDFAVLDIDLVADEANRDVFADSGQVLMPFRNILVGDSRGDVEHDDGTVSSNVVSLSEAAQLLLSSSVPDVEFDGAVVGEENDRRNFDSLSG